MGGESYKGYVDEICENNRNIYRAHRFISFPYYFISASRKNRIIMSIKIEMKSMYDLVTQIKRGLSSYYVQNEGREVSFINIKDVSRGNVDVKSVEKVKIKETGALEKSRIQPKDIIITAKGSAFKVAVANDKCKDFVISSNLIALTLNNEILPEIVAAYLNSPCGQRELQSRSAGVAQRALNIKSLLETKIPVPDKKNQKFIAEYFILAKEYETLSRKEQELRKKINDQIIADNMRRYI